MSNWQSPDDVLDFAIREEDAAAKFYVKLANQAKDSGMREAFESFAAEETAHKERLLAVKSGSKLAASKESIAELQSADYLVDIAPDPKMGYREALIVAMKKEKAAFRLYTDLASSVTDAGLKSLFQVLAQEEARHKLRFEVEYDDMSAKGENY
ncbi:MAG TPA: ferritin family protein [Planctomycetota bacterium]|jgi:rubrerythrin